MRVYVEFERPPKSVQNFGIRVLSDQNFYNFTELGIKDGKKIYTDRRRSGLVHFNPDFARLDPVEAIYDLNSEWVVSLELLLDSSSVEAFFFEGLQTMSNLVYPSTDKQRFISLFPDDDLRLKVRKLQVTEISKI